MHLDRESLLAHIDGTVRMPELRRFLAAEGVDLVLDSDPPDVTVNEWLAKGAPGARARFVDPVDQLVAGCTFRMKNGEIVEIRPSPRRSVGPDLFALVFGMGERFATVIHAHLRVAYPGTAYVSPAFRAPADPPIEEGEAKLLGEIERLQNRPA